MCAVFAGWAIVAQLRLRHMRRVNRVALACIAHWRRQAGITRRQSGADAVAVLPRRHRRAKANVGRRVW
jgi:hypothetical protein